MLKAAIVLFVYAAVLIGMGVLAYLLSPEGANAATALAIPGVAGLLTLIAGVLCLLGNKPAMIGVHVGLVLPVLFAAGFAFRALPATQAHLEAKAELAKIQQTVDQGVGGVIGEVQGRIERGERVLPDAGATAEALSRGYLIATLWGLTGASALTFVSLLMLRPKPSR